jgi:TfoX/Sxy family transcriptional regulator of competence genes
MKFDKSPQWLVQLFDALQRETGGARRQMFGYPCAFENGQLFAGLFGDGMFVRLSEPDRAALLKTPGATPFAPMAGRPMKEYVVLPPSMLEDEEAVKGWLGRGLGYAQSLPPKRPKAAKSKAAKPKAQKKR